MDGKSGLELYLLELLLLQHKLDYRHLRDYLENEEALREKVREGRSKGK